MSGILNCCGWVSVCSWELGDRRQRLLLLAYGFVGWRTGALGDDYSVCTLRVESWIWLQLRSSVHRMEDNPTADIANRKVQHRQLPSQSASLAGYELVLEKSAGCEASNQKGHLNNMHFPVGILFDVLPL